MSRIVLLCTVLALPVLGCSGGEFGVAASGDDASTSDDTSTDATSGGTSDGTSDSTSDSTSDTAPGDSCEKNACGGCAKLEGAPGDACGCEGELACDGVDALACQGSKPTNACGGCAALANPPDTACGGACGSAKYACDGPEATKCVDPVTTPAPGTKCGTCETLQWTCKADKLSTECPGDDANACGGCKEIAAALLPGKSCGKCGSGAYACAASKEATQCADPVTTPAPGTKCGYCGAVYKCNVAKDATFCEDDDDRVTGTDTFHATYSERLFSVAPSEEPHLAISFKTKRAGSITDLSLAFQRYDQSAGALPSSLRVRLIKGSPTATPAAGDVLATISLPADTVPDVPGPINLKLPVATPNLPANTALWIDLADASERFNFELHGGNTTGPSDLKLWYRDTSAPTGWAAASGVWPYLTVSGLGCF